MSDLQSSMPAQNPEDTKGKWRGKVGVLSVVLPLQIIVLSVCLVAMWCCISASEHKADKAGSAVPAQAAGAEAKPGISAATPSVTTATGVTVSPPKPEAGRPALATEDGGAAKGPARAGLNRFMHRLCEGECGLLILVMLSGALGGAVHAANSFVAYVGARSFVSSWFQWYLQRAPLGAGLATMVYFALRAGLMTSSTSGEDLNHFGFAAVGLLTGMFNTEALAKLKKVAEAFFSSAPTGRDTLAVKSVPELLGLDPLVATAGADLPIKLTGTGFTADTWVNAGGQALKPLRWTATSLEAVIPAAMLKAGQVLPVWVTTGSTGPRSVAQFSLRIS
ncbi:MAG TPA: hypothetical protein VIO38_04465 [Rariglobus sp.]